VKFLLDMGISPETGFYLEKLGHNAIHLIDEGMDRATDSQIMEKALKEERIILTHDLDFGRMLAFSGDKGPSVVTFRLTNMRPENVNQFCNAIIDRFSDVMAKGAILSVGDKKIRSHLLPVLRNR
jgi:predicted nuclease of predicted toxin-antitoxin system